MTTPTMMTLLIVPMPGPLAQRDPEEKHRGADDDRPRPDREAERPRQALVEDVPRVEAEACEDEQRRADPVQEQAGVQLGEPQEHRRNATGRDPSCAAAARR